MLLFGGSLTNRVVKHAAAGPLTGRILLVSLNISVVIPTHQQRFLSRCLEGLAEQSNTAFEVIVVENGVAVAGTRDLVDRYRPHLQVRYRHDAHLGLNRARNTGAALAGTNVVALLDDDCRPVPSWIDALIGAHTEHPDCGTIGGRVYLDFSEQPPDWLVGPFRQFLGTVDWSSVTRPLQKGEWLVGANLSFRKSVWLEAGGFRENFGMVGRSHPQLGNDEFEFIRRAGKPGRNRSWYLPQAAVSHRICASRTTIDWFEWRAYGQGRSDVALLKLKEPETGTHALYRTLYDYASRFVSESLRRHPAIGEENSALQFEDNLFRCRLAQLHGMFDAIASTDQRFVACVNAPGAYRTGVSAIHRQLRLYPLASTHQLFDKARQELRDRIDHTGEDETPEAWLSELAGMRDEIVTRATGSVAGPVEKQWNIGLQTSAVT